MNRSTPWILLMITPSCCLKKCWLLHLLGLRLVFMAKLRLLAVRPGLLLKIATSFNYHSKLVTFERILFILDYLYLQFLNRCFCSIFIFRYFLLSFFCVIFCRQETISRFFVSIKMRQIRHVNCFPEVVHSENIKKFNVLQNFQQENKIVFVNVFFQFQNSSDLNQFSNKV